MRQKDCVFLVWLVYDMPNTLAQIHDEIVEAISCPALNAIIKGTVVNKLKLWGTTRPCNFQKGMIYATLLKDIQGLGYLKLQKRFMEYSDLSNEAIQHNVKLVWHVLGKWAQTVVTTDDLQRLGHGASKTQWPPPLGFCCLVDWLHRFLCEGEAQHSQRQEPVEPQATCTWEEMADSQQCKGDGAVGCRTLSPYSVWWRLGYP